MSEPFKIESNVPLPPARHSKPVKHQWLYDLEPGQSVLIPDGSVAQISGTVYGTAHRLNRKFTIRRQKEGAYRVWRVS